jgi:hypothetical protein
MLLSLYEHAVVTEETKKPLENHHTEMLSSRAATHAKAG